MPYIAEYVRVDRSVVSHVTKNSDAKGTDFVLRVGSAHGRAVDPVT